MRGPGPALRAVLGNDKASLASSCSLPSFSSNSLATFLALTRIGYDLVGALWPSHFTLPVRFRCIPLLTRMVLGSHSAGLVFPSLLRPWSFLMYAHILHVDTNILKPRPAHPVPPNAHLQPTITPTHTRTHTFTLSSHIHTPNTPRSRDVRATEKDKVEMYRSFRPGDVVRAEVISLAENKNLDPSKTCHPFYPGTPLHTHTPTLTPSLHVYTHVYAIQITGCACDRERQG